MDYYVIKKMKAKVEKYLAQDLYKFAFLSVSNQQPAPKEWERYKYYTDLGKMFDLVNNESLNIVWRKAETSWKNERQRRSITNRANNLCGQIVFNLGNRNCGDIMVANA